MKVQRRDNSAKAKAAVLSDLDKRLKMAAIALSSEIARSMGTEGGGVMGLGPGEVNRSRKRNRYFAAPPGSYPGVRTGKLRRSITWSRAAPGRYRVGTNIRYGRYLEFGTIRMQPRPWLRRTLNRMRPRLRQIIGGRR